MLFFYSKKAGLVANFALVANMFFIIGILASLGAVLTLPGIAGIVLTIGMSVDANVLIYERVQEELNAGKGLKLAISDGYKNAYSAIIDGQVTTMLTGIVLYLFGSGPIKGFATTLVIGILTSLFSAIFITRLIFEVAAETQQEYHLYIENDQQLVTEYTYQIPRKKENRLHYFRLTDSYFSAFNRVPGL
jgi:SecD/SecF fusion protein